MKLPDNKIVISYYLFCKRCWEDKPQPAIEKPTDAVVRITHTTICGTDLHILKGDVPAVTAGRILGHEGLGVVEEVGSGVSNIKVGDEVLISCGRHAQRHPAHRARNWRPERRG